MTNGAMVERNGVLYRRLRTTAGPKCMGKPAYYLVPITKEYQGEEMMTLTTINILTGDAWQLPVTQAEGNKMISWLSQTCYELNIRCTLRERETHEIESRTTYQVERLKGYHSHNLLAYAEARAVPSHYGQWGVHHGNETSA